MDILKMSEEHVEECTDLYIDAFTKSPWHDAYDSRAQVVSFFSEPYGQQLFSRLCTERANRDRRIVHRNEKTMDSRNGILYRPVLRKAGGAYRWGMSRSAKEQTS